MSDGSNVNTVGACGCCQGTTGLTPVVLTNRPSLSALVYRVGIQPLFKESMLAEISAKDALGKLTTREDDDPVIAILDAWAVTLDVLTFYQERIANEGFLRTATERRSLLELARTIGYELRPGVAASTWLAFTLDGSPGSPPEVIIPGGTRAQSLPTKTELPQSFETGEDLLARPEWNVLKPQLLGPQEIGSDPGKVSTAIFLDGVATQLRPGDALLIVNKTDSTEWDFRVLKEVEADSKAGVTRVAWQGALTVPAGTEFRVFALRQRAALFGATAPDWKGMTDDFKKAYMTAAKFDYEPTKPSTWATDWPGTSVIGAATQIDLDAAYPRIAPESWVVLKAGSPGTQIRLFWVTGVDTVSRSGFSLSARVTRLTVTPVAGAGDFGREETAVFAESEELAPAQQVVTDPVSGKTIKLDVLVGGLIHGRAVIVQGKRMRVQIQMDAGYLVAEDGSGRVQIQAGDTLQVLARPTDGIWRLRDRNGFEGIVTLTGSPRLFPAEDADPVVAEVAVLAEANPGKEDKERTVLTLIDPLANLFDRTTVSVFANVAAATHGETRTEVLGSGDASKRFQRFRLRQKPLTYTAAPVPGGGESTLALRVNGVLWHEAPDFFELGPRDREYVLRRDDDANTTVRFGDGVHGARVPTGVENVEAVYRTGIGLSGLVDEDRISLLVTRPLGVKSVTNPVPATGAADPETRDLARRNAPTTVLTLDRVVSLRDFEDFARSFSGIGKAQARMLWASGHRLVHLTVAGVGGAPVVPGSALDKNFRAALDRLRDPFQALRVESYDHLLFHVHLRVKVDPDYVKETVLARVEAALRNTFAFDARDFGQSVFLSEVMAVAQRAEGVVYVDIDSLTAGQTDATLTEEGRLTAQPARIDGTGTVLRAEILTLSPEPVVPEAIP
jgi:hypothetical protein